MHSFHSFEHQHPFWPATGMQGLILMSTATNFSLSLSLSFFFSKSSAFDFNGIGRKPFVPWSFKNSPAYLKACNSTLDIYFSSQGPHLL